jgi:hypothetical protein
MAPFKGTVPRDFRLWVFSVVFPKRLSRFEFFRKFAEIFAAQGAPPVMLLHPFTNKIVNIVTKNVTIYTLVF